MDFNWFIKNIRRAQRLSDGYVNQIKTLLWIYSHKLPGFLIKNESIIGFDFGGKTGKLKLLLRSNHGSDHFIFSEVFEHQYYFIKFNIEPVNIIDLGANIGLTTIYFSRLFPQASLACVEPDLDNLRCLENNLSLNGVTANIIPAAINDKDGYVYMKEESKDYAHRVVPRPLETDKTVFHVKALSMQSLLQQLGWERISLLKIDIEGHENVLFSGNTDWLESVDNMIIEFHSTGAESLIREQVVKHGLNQPEIHNGMLLIKNQYA